MRFLLLKIIRIYQVCLSPLMANHCRFEPCCSSYMYTAIQKHGIFKGGLLGVMRLSRCHPWHEGGYDPVPQCKHSKNYGNSSC